MLMQNDRIRYDLLALQRKVKVDDDTTKRDEEYVVVGKRARMKHDEEAQTWQNKKKVTK